MKQYFLRVLTLISQIINTVVLLGHHDRTISARCYINKEKKYWKAAYKVINKIFYFQKNHCKTSFQDDTKFAKEVLELEEKDKKDECNASQS